MTDLLGATLLLAVVGAPEGLDALAADTSLIPTRAVEQARASRAQAGEAEAALRRVAGVQDARVVLGDPGISVVIRHDPGPPPLSDADVRIIVAASLSDVAVSPAHVLFSAARPATGQASDRPSGLVPILGIVCLAIGGWAARRSLFRR